MSNPKFNNSIIISRNEKKTKDTHPDFRGQVQLSPEILEDLKETNTLVVSLSLWSKTTQDGRKILNGEVQLPYELRKNEIAPAKEPETRKTIDDLEDDLQF